MAEANIKKDKKENAKIIKQYINNEANQKALITEFEIINKKYGSDEQLAFILKSLLYMVANITQDYKKLEAGKTIVTSFLLKKEIEGNEDIANHLTPFLGSNDITNLSRLNKGTYEGLKPLNELMTKLRNICESPNPLLTEAQPEAASSQSQNVA